MRKRMGLPLTLIWSPNWMRWPMWAGSLLTEIRPSMMSCSISSREPRPACASTLCSLGVSACGNSTRLGGAASALSACGVELAGDHVGEADRHGGRLGRRACRGTARRSSSSSSSSLAPRPPRRRPGRHRAGVRGPRSGGPPPARQAGVSLASTSSVVGAEPRQAEVRSCFRSRQLAPHRRRRLRPRVGRIRRGGRRPLFAVRLRIAFDGQAGLRLGDCRPAQPSS